MKSSLYITSFMPLVSYSKLCRLFSNSDIVLHFTLRLITHFQLLYVKGLKSVPWFFFFFFAGRCPVVPAPFIERITFAPLYCLCTFAQISYLYFWVLYSISLIHFVDMKLRYCGSSLSSVNMYDVYNKEQYPQQHWYIFSCQKIFCRVLIALSTSISLYIF